MIQLILLFLQITWKKRTYAVKEKINSVFGPKFQFNTSGTKGKTLKILKYCIRIYKKKSLSRYAFHRMMLRREVYSCGTDSLRIDHSTDWPTESNQKRPRHPTEKVCKQVKEPTSSPVISIFFIQAHPKYYVCFTQ